MSKGFGFNKYRFYTCKTFKVSLSLPLLMIFYRIEQIIVEQTKTCFQWHPSWRINKERFALCECMKQKRRIMNRHAERRRELVSPQHSCPSERGSLWKRTDSAIISSTLVSRTIPAGKGSAKASLTWTLNYQAKHWTNFSTCRWSRGWCIVHVHTYLIL